MLQNYVSAALRNLFRSRAYAAINLLGLALGVAAAILIMLYVHDEYSYNHFLPNADRIYQIGEIIQPPGGTLLRTSVTFSDVAPMMQLDFSEVELATRLVSDRVRLSHSDTEDLSIVAYWAEPNFFQMFRLSVISGSFNTALSQPDGLVLTRSTARRLFGEETAVGQTLTLDHAQVLRVTAVIEDLPSNSTFRFEALLPAIASFSALTKLDIAARQSDALKAENVYSFVRLRPDVDMEHMRSGLRAFADRRLTTKVNGVPLAKAYTFILTAMTEVHFLPPNIGEMKPPADPRLTITMTGIAVLIMLLASGNFVSMMTARAAHRAVEVGVRKVVGATRRQIMFQFMGECLFLSAVAVAVATILVNAALPSFNAFLQRDIKFNYLTNSSLAATLIALVFVVGLIAGAYPALVLSRFRPRAVLKSITIVPMRMGHLRNLLVVFQFGALIVLLVATMTIHRQTQFAIEDRLHLPGNQIYFGGIRLHQCPKAFINSVAALQGVRAASCSSGSALSMGRFSAIFESSSGSAVYLRADAVDFGFFDVFDIKPVAGRLLSPQRGEDAMLIDGSEISANPAIVINESAMRALGFGSPREAIGQFRRWSRIKINGDTTTVAAPFSSAIVGVVPDFSIGSARDAIEPTAYYVDPSWFDHVAIKLDGNSIPETLRNFNALWSQHDALNPFRGTFLNQYVNGLYADVVRQATIFAIFTGVAIVIASLGLLGLAIYTVERRTKEIGIRKVMGASRNDILRFLGWKFALPLVWANAVAWPCSYLVMKHWLEGFAYHINMSFYAFVISGLLATAIALATVAGHTFVVARTKPIEALRYE